MATFSISDAFHIVEPLLDGTLLTAWVMGPIYACVHGLIFFIVERVKNNKKNEAEEKEMVTV